jgi:hypothetical protein
MRIRYIAACALATGAFGAWGGEVSVFNNMHDSAAGGGCSVNGVCVNFNVEKFDDLDGVMQGTVRATILDPNSQAFFHIINCSGPAFANSLLFKHANGDATISVTLDPSSPGCSGVNFSAPVILNIAGQFDGFSKVSNDGFFTNYTRGEISRGRHRSERYTNTFDGIVGPFSGMLFGVTSATRNFRQELD